MKSLIFSITLVLSSLTFISNPNTYARGCSSHLKQKTEVECLPKDKKCLDAKKQQTLNRVEA